MAVNDRFRHVRIDKTNLPYVTNVSVTESRPHWLSGSTNTLAHIRGWMERRPGFALYATNTFATAPGPFFTWQRWDGSFFIMTSALDGMGNTIIYKLKVGTDTTFQGVSTVGGAALFDFVEANNKVYYANGIASAWYDGTNQRGWGADGPGTNIPSAADAGSGNVPALIGHRYIYAYGDSTTGYISDVSNPSNPITTPSRIWTVTGTKSIEAQIDKVHVYRTEDGGNVYLELPDSPVTNTGGGTWSITDNYPDAQLVQSSPAPFPGVNAPAPFGPPLQGFRFYAGRIWGFKQDKVFFTTYEENTTSIPVECWGQPLTNSFSFGSQVMGLGLTTDFLIVFTTRGIYRIGGDSLNTFTRSTLARNMGLRNKRCVAEYDGRCAWLDISNTIQSTDGYSIAADDISLPIRPDIAAIDHSLASMAFYATGTNRWIVLSDGGAGKLRVFDMNLNQWNSPWPVASCGIVGAGQTAAGTFVLFLAIGVRACYLTPATYTDLDVAYTAGLYSHLFPVNPDNPTGTGVMQYVGTEQNNIALSDVKYLTDEDPASGTYISVVDKVTDPDSRYNGTALVEKWYWSNTPAAARVSVALSWAAAATKFILYTLDLAFRREN